MVVISPLLPFKYYFLIDGSMKIVYGYIHCIWNFFYGPEIFQMVLCVSLSDIMLLESQDQNFLLVISV